MLAVFVFGIALTASAPATTASQFFVIYAVIGILVVVLGLELHTYTDRLVATGMAPRIALVGLARAQALWIAAVCVAAAVAGTALGWGAGLAAIVALNAVLGLLVQECFRMFIVLGRQGLANFCMVARTTVPFGTLTLATIAGGHLSTEAIFLTWAAGGLLATVPAAVWLWRYPGATNGGEFIQGKARRVASRYFPSTLAARAFFSVDVIVVGALGPPEVAAAFGNAANIAAAFFTFADLAVTQWRMRGLITNRGDANLARAHLRDTALVSAVSLISLVGVGVAAHLGAFGPDFQVPDVALLFALLGVGSAMSIGAQALQVRAYAAQLDGVVLRAYVLACVPYAALIVLAVVLAQPMLAVAGRAVAFSAVSLYLAFGYRRGRTPA